MKGNPSARPDGGQGRPKKAAPKVSKEASVSTTGGSKKRRWVQPKDKSLLRKTFLKIRDAKARSQFSKLQKKTGEAIRLKPDSRPPIATGDDNEAFLQRLLNPFAKPAPKEPSSPSESATDTGMRGRAINATRRKDSNASAASSATFKATDGAQELDAAEGRATPQVAQEGEKEHLALLAEAPGASGGAYRMGNKGYMPFLKAQQEFQAKQRENEALRVARQAEAQKEMRRKREKKRFDKVAHKKLQARTKKGQLVMGNVVDVLLLKMHKSSCQ